MFSSDWIYKQTNVAVFLLLQQFASLGFSKRYYGSMGIKMISVSSFHVMNVCLFTLLATLILTLVRKTTLSEHCVKLSYFSTLFIDGIKIRKLFIRTTKTCNIVFSFPAFPNAFLIFPYWITLCFWYLTSIRARFIHDAEVKRFQLIFDILCKP